MKYVKEVVENRGGSRVKSLVVKLGALQSIDREVLEFALREISRNENISIEELKFVVEQPLLRCRRCGHEWELDISSIPQDVAEAIHFVPEVVHSFFKCPRCGSRDFAVVRGRGLSVEHVEVV